MHPPLIGVVAHRAKPGAAELIRQLADEFGRRHLSALFEQQTAAIAGLPPGLPVADLGRRCDLIMVLGGDGTMLQVVHDLRDHRKPLFGINLGTLGFLTCVGAADCRRAVEAVADRRYVLSRRTLIEVAVVRGGQAIARRVGLNDVTISRGELSRLIRLATRVDGSLLTEYHADGLILATPTGSTAYSLSAGGPILVPASDVFVITPICPHVLTNRSLIVPDTAHLEIEPTSADRKAFLTVDGQQLVTLQTGDLVQARKAAQELELATLPDVSFFEVLRQKLKWSGSAV